MNNNDSLRLAVSEWNQVLGRDNVLEEGTSVLKYSNNTEGLKRYIPAVLLPKSTEQVICIVNIAQKYRIPIYPISTGNNWGYGTACPVHDGSVVVDLKNMNRIIEFDNDLGLVTLEPSVSQQQLYEHLLHHNYSYLVPTTGAGPNCSILANALERGYGLTPHADHFSSIMSLEAVLPNGQVYHSPFSHMKAPNLDKAFKWGIGPYLDGIFSQSSFGIVTKMTLSLAPVPEQVETFWFELDSNDRVNDVVTCIRKIMKTCKSNVSGINLMNARRVLAMKRGCLINSNDDNAQLTDLMAQYDVSAWTGMGAIYGHHSTVRSIKQVIRNTLSGFCKKLHFQNLDKVRKLKRLLSIFPFLQHRMKGLFFYEKMLEILNGIPNEIALQIAYLKAKNKSLKCNLNPAHDGCGLIWYSPLVEMKGDRIKEYIQMVEKICKQHGIDPLITLTGISDTCFDSTVPILFDPHSELDNAKTCYETLFSEGQKIGFLPYRMSSQFMHLAVKDTPYWELIRSLKNTVDPNHILSPKRYTL